MLVEKETLKKALLKRCESLTKREKQTVAIKCLDTHQIPLRVSGGIMSFTKEPEDLGDIWVFVAYCILNSLEENVSNYFTETEISVYEKETYPAGKAAFPIIIKAIQVSDDQFIGSITAKDIISFGRADLINYNADTQRVMRRIIRGENTIFKINLDNKAVQEIKTLFLNGNYVPNVITLNIPLGQGDFYYDQDKRELVIKSLEAFNIIDGYHRYRALASIISEDEKFDYPLEIRITNFDNDKANSFIWQEDQKNRMAKVDSDSFNPADLANRITKRVNQASDSNIRGCLDRNGGNIVFSDFASCVKYYYLADAKEKNQNQMLIVVSNNIISKWNELTFADTTFMTRDLKFRDLGVIFYLLLNLPVSDIPATYTKIIESINVDEGRTIFYSRQMNKRTEKYIEKMYNAVNK